MNWTLDKSRPICPQICELICVAVANREYAPGEKLLSVREIALLAGVNPNTVQKAFAELDRAGLIVSYPGRGCFVSPGAREAIRERGQAKLSEITAIAADLLRAGFSPDELHDAIDRACRAPHAPQERKEAL